MKIKDYTLFSKLWEAYIKSGVYNKINFHAYLKQLNVVMTTDSFTWREEYFIFKSEEDYFLCLMEFL